MQKGAETRVSLRMSHQCLECCGAPTTEWVLRTSKIMGLLMLCDFVKWMYHVNRLIKKYNILALVSHICKIHPNRKLVALVMHKYHVSHVCCLSLISYELLAILLICGLFHVCCFSPAELSYSRSILCATPITSISVLPV